MRCFPGTVKSDRTDAEAIAQMGIGGRTAIRPIAETDELDACVSLVDLYHFFGQCGLRNYEAPLNCKTSRPKGRQVTNNLATKYSDE